MLKTSLRQVDKAPVGKDSPKLKKQNKIYRVYTLLAQEARGNYRSNSVIKFLADLQLMNKRNKELFRKCKK